MDNGEPGTGTAEDDNRTESPRTAWGPWQAGCPSIQARFPGLGGILLQEAWQHTYGIHGMNSVTIPWFNKSGKRIFFSARLERPRPEGHERTLLQAHLDTGHLAWHRQQVPRSAVLHERHARGPNLHVERCDSCGGVLHGLCV